MITESLLMCLSRTLLVYTILSLVSLATVPHPTKEVTKEKWVEFSVAPQDLLMSVRSSL